LPIKKLGRDFIEAGWRRLFHRPLQPPYSIRWIAAWGALVSVLSTRMPDPDHLDQSNTARP
jgi:hypothetical protein